jgi:hypothetical protein
MLAYVFWHWPSPGADRAEYELRQRAFHAALRDAPSPGFQRSFTQAISSAPWANTGRDAYEDWYVIDGSAALDPLNDAAVSAPHERAARDAAGGTAGLYRLRCGAASREARIACWFDKPPGLGYAELLDLARAACERDDVGLWIRQMTLGPAPECCLLGAGSDALPPALRGRDMALRRVWPAAGERTARMTAAPNPV